MHRDCFVTLTEVSDTLLAIEGSYLFATVRPIK